MNRLSLTIALAATALCMMAQPARSYKRGISENAFSSPNEIAALAPGVTWYYDWGITPHNNVASVTGPEEDKLIEFVPMCWNGNFNEAGLRQYLTEHPGVKYLLGFNEPNFRAQANMTPQQAAEQWPRLEAIAEEFGLKLVAPALNYPDGAINDGNTYSPEAWMDAFLAAYPAAKFDYLALHCYMNAPTAQIGFVENFAKKYGKQVWLTEFCSWEGNVDSISQLTAMVQKVQDLEQSEHVYRYAWFKAKGSVANPYYRLFLEPKLTDRPKVYGNLTQLGLVYVNLSSFDKNYYYNIGDTILAKDYMACKGVEIKPSTDPDSPAPIQIHSFSVGSSVSYQLDVPQAGDYKLQMRVSARAFILAPKIDVLVDDNVVTTLNVEVTGMTNTVDDWATREFTVTLPAGKHRITLNSKQSTQCRIGWLRFASLNEPALKGDVDGNGVVNANDIAAVVNVIAGTEPEEKYEGRADVDGNDVINANDIADVVNIIAGL